MNRRGFIGFVLCCAFLFTPVLSFASFGTLEGYVTDEMTGYGIYGAIVRLHLGGENYIFTATGGGGYYEFLNTVPAGSGYGLIVIKSGYVTYTGTCPDITAGVRVREDVVLSTNPGTGTISGIVYDEHDDPMMGVHMAVNFSQARTDQNGQYQFILNPGSYPVEARLAGFENYLAGDIPVSQDETTNHDIHMVPGIVDAYAGAYQWGESRNSNGILTIGDADEMAAEIAEPGQGDYSDCFTPDPMIQDLDGDNVLGPSDQAILSQWLAGDWSGIPAEGVPDRIELTNPPTQVAIDEGGLLQVMAMNGTTAESRAGWGIVFAIDGDLSTCESATLLGRPFPTIPGTGPGFTHLADTVFSYSDGNGYAYIWLRVNGCEIGDQVVVDVFIPNDMEARIWGERFPTTLHGDDSFSLEVVEGGGGGGLCFAGTAM